VGHSLDVLHGESDTWARDAADLTGYLKCPLLLTSVTTLQRTPVAEGGMPAYARLFGVADGYHFVSEYLRDNQLSLGLSGVPIWLVNHGVDLDRYVPSTGQLSSPGAQFRVLSVCRTYW